MKYSNKEKQKHFAELRNPEAAAADLELLRQVKPDHSSLTQFSRNPKRYSDDILYLLLDFSLRDEIRNNRRKVEEPEPDPAEELAKKAAEERTAEAEKVEAEERAKAAEKAKEEAEERAAEAEAAQEEAEERAEEAETALEQEKKKVKPTPKPKVAKSKSKKNTPKSTGTTSSTHKSKQPPSSTTTE